MKFRENPKFKKTEPDKTSRRSFLKKAVKGIGTLFLAGYIGLIPIACKKTPFTPEPPPTPPHQVIVKVDFYNHTQGIIGEKTYSGMSSQPGLIIKVNDCPNTSFPEENTTTYQAYLMTITNPYDKGNLNLVGKNLWAYVFVKDSKT